MQINQQKTKGTVVNPAAVVVNLKSKACQIKSAYAP